jgi:hypothetical protein
VGVGGMGGGGGTIDAACTLACGCGLLLRARFGDECLSWREAGDFRLLFLPSNLHRLQYGYRPDKPIPCLSQNIQLYCDDIVQYLIAIKEMPVTSPM